MSEQPNPYTLLLLHTSIPLRKLNTDNKPIGIASGCLIEFAGKRVLLTVQHAVNEGHWAAEVKFDKNKGMKLCNLGSMLLMKSINLAAGTVQDVDFASTEIDDAFESWLQLLDVSGNVISESERVMATVDFSAAPTQDQTYGFAGQVDPEWHGADVLVAKLAHFEGLTFDRTDGDYHYFKLPGKHPGHDAFKGCSGAPIIDSDGNTVSLVCGGNTDTNEIYGLALRNFESLLEQEYALG